MKNAQVEVMQGLAQVGGAVLDAIVDDARQRAEKEKEDQIARAVQAITDAIFEGRRIKLDVIRDMLPGGSQMHSHEIPEYLYVPPDFFNAAIKKWYHIF